MRDLGTLWKQCHNGTIPKGEWDYERRLTIDGVVYYDENIIKVEHEKALTGDTISLGNAVASKIRATVIPHVSYTVRKNGEIKLELRVVTLNDGVSDWYEFGYFYIDNAKREADKWNIIGYDKLYSLEVPFPASEGQAFSVTQALDIITNHMGISIDERSLPFVVRNNLTGLEKYSMREVLGYLGSLNFGNWHITEENKLHLIRFGIDNSNYEVGANNSKRLISSTTMKFDKVVVKYGQSPSDKFEVGSGDNEIEIFNPWADPAMADDIYYVLKDYTFYPGETRSTEIDPAVELGDTITVDGNKINLWQIDYSTRMYADIYTPVDTEMFNQYQFTASEGHDYSQDIQQIKSRLDTLEDLVGIAGCVVVSEENGNVAYLSAQWIYIGNDKCVIIPREIRTGAGDLYSIGYMFEDTSVEKVILNHSTIQGMNSTFRRLKSTNLDLQNFNTSEVRNMRYMFENSNVVYLNLSSFDTSKVTDMRGMFLRSKAENIILSSFDTSNVENMEYMFAGSSANVLDLSNFNTPKVTNMQGMFAGSKAASVNLSSFNTSKVTDMGSMFEDSLATELDLSSFDTSSVTNMHSMFFGSQAANLNISSFDTSNVVNMINMFRDSEALSLELGFFDTSKVIDMSNMFWGSKATHIDLSSFDTSNVTDMQGMFSSSNVQSLNVSNFDTSNAVRMYNMFSDLRITDLDLSNFNTINAEDMVGMFNGCDDLKTLDLSGNFTINGADARNIFPNKRKSEFEDVTHLTVYCNSDNHLELRSQYEEDHVYSWMEDMSDHNISFVIKSTGGGDTGGGDDNNGGDDGNVNVEGSIEYFNLEDLTVNVGDEDIYIDLNNYFTDINGESITFTINIYGEGHNVGINFNGDMVFITPNIPGETTIEVTAANVSGDTVTQEFVVKVN